MAKRTTREFVAVGDLWTIIERWAGESGFETLESQAERRLYRRGREHFDYPILVEISQAQGRVQLMAWVKASALDRGRALFMVPAEMGLESGGAQLMVARNTGRKLVNTLLSRLGQPPIV